MSGPKNRDTTMEAKAELQAMGFEPVPVLKAIRAKCLDCSGGMASEVRDCLVPQLRPLSIPHGHQPLASPGQRRPTGGRQKAVCRQKSSKR